MLSTRFKISYNDCIGNKWRTSICVNKVKLVNQRTDAMHFDGSKEEYRSRKYAREVEKHDERTREFFQ